MHDELSRILHNTRELQQDLEREMTRHREDLASSMDKGRVRFAGAVLVPQGR
jgi:hypothetical protein